MIFPTFFFISFHIFYLVMSHHLLSDLYEMLTEKWKKLMESSSRSLKMYRASEAFAEQNCIITHLFCALFSTLLNYNALFQRISLECVFFSRFLNIKFGRIIYDDFIGISAVRLQRSFFAWAPPLRIILM